MADLNELERRAGVRFFDHQSVAFEAIPKLGQQGRACLYFPTGKGKTITSLVAVALTGHDHCVVITPPATFPAWEVSARKLGMTLTLMSHAKFRMKGTKLARNVPVIADEFHLFGGHGGLGWAKFDRMAMHLQAPIIIASATPNYNDAERVYCIQHVLNPFSCKGGYLQFLYDNCVTEANQFAMMPIVTGFRNYASAEEYLAALPNVFYIPDELVYTIGDIDVSYPLPPEFEEYGVNRRAGRIVASQIEEKHAKINLQLVGDDGLIRPHVHDELAQLMGQASGPVLVFAQHSTVAQALGATLSETEMSYAVVDGKTPQGLKLHIIQQFREGRFDVLVGTATLATGTDGLDKVCDLLVIVDDTEDDSLRRQLIGRIMPRGDATDASKKVVARLTLA